MASSLATSPAGAPPMPSHTTNRPSSARDMKASSFWGRTRPVSVRAPTRSRIATSDYKPYAGIDPGAEVTIWDGDNVELRWRRRQEPGRVAGAFRTRVTEASVLLFGQFQELRLMPCSLLEREEDTLQQY